MIFIQEMKKYNNLSDEDKIKKIINLLKVIKDKNEKFAKTYTILTTNKNLPIKMVDEIYKVLLEGMIYQQWLTQKNSNEKIDDINNSLHSHLEQEKLERETEKDELEALLA